MLMAGGFTSSSSTEQVLDVGVGVRATQKGSYPLVCRWDAGLSAEGSSF